MKIDFLKWLYGFLWSIENTFGFNTFKTREKIVDKINEVV